MAIFEEFIHREAEYLTWIENNPDGFVLNANSAPRATYMPLHTTACHTIKDKKSNARYDAFTGHGYIKVCSNDPNALRAWMARYGAHDFSALCSKCKPDILSFTDQVAAQEVLLNSEARKLMANRDKLQQQIAALPKEPPSFYYAQTKVFRRNPAVVADALLRANGVCEKCRNGAPFLRSVDKQPFLEVHHKVRLADGGIDHPENAIALCPNCHRQEHFG